MGPFKKVQAIWEKDKKKVTKPPCSGGPLKPTVMPVINLAIYGPVDNSGIKCIDHPILGGRDSKY